MIAIKPYLLFFVVCGRTSVLRQYNFSCYNNVKLLLFFSQCKLTTRKCLDYLKKTTRVNNNKALITTSIHGCTRHYLQSKLLQKFFMNSVDQTVNMFTSSLMSSHRKPKTKRSKRFLESRAPKLVEDVKTAMIMKGGNTSQTITQALKDIVSYPPANQPLQALV